MNVVQAPAPGRRIPRGLFGALVVFLISPFPALCLAAPLAGRLLLARPRTGREWGWISGALFLVVAVFAAEQNLAQQLLIGYSLAFTGAVLALQRWRPGPVFPRVAVAAVDMATLFTMIAWAAGIQWSEVRLVLETQFQQQLTEALSVWKVSPAQATDLRKFVSGLATVFPGVAVLGAIAGGMLSHALAWHISGGRSGEAPVRFREFRFNDHLIWGAIVTLGLVLAPLRTPWSVLAFNLLLVWAGVYAARGTAVAFSMVARWSLSFRLALLISGALLLPYAAGALMLVGLADTWLDLRRSHGPPAQGVMQ